MFQPLGLGLIASGFRGLKQYWRELAILFFLGVPSILAHLVTDISPLTGKLAAFLLWYTGFDVSIEGSHISLPTGSVGVGNGCSGIETMAYLLGVAVLFLVMFPLKRGLRVLVVTVALTIAFIFNSVRVALLAVVAGVNTEAFDYWHAGEGSLLFGIVEILIFGLFYMFLMKQDESETNTVTSPLFDRHHLHADRNTHPDTSHSSKNDSS